MAKFASTSKRATTPRRRSDPKNRVTLLDIAKHTGLSRTTVSDVLNRGDVAGLYADETRRKVQEAVTALGYAPHAGAQQLAKGRSNLIGLVLLRDFANPYFARLADAIDREVRRQGLRLHLAVGGEDGDRASTASEAELIARMRAEAASGLIIGPVYEDFDLQQHKALLTGELPTVLFGDEIEQLDSIGEARDAGFGAAVSHLVELGHRRIGYLCAPPCRPDPTRVDHLPTLRMLAASGCSAGPQWIAWHPDNGDLDGYAESVNAWTDQWLAADPADRPTAVMCLNDATALVALGIFSSRGIRVPQDLSIVGYDDLPESRHLVPALTTVNSNTPRQAELTVQQLRERIANPTADPVHLEVEPELIVRASTARPGG